MDTYDVAYKLGCALRLYVDEFDARNNRISNRLRLAAEDGNPIAKQFHVAMTGTGYYCDTWESMISHLIYASLAHFNSPGCQDMRFKISRAYAQSQLTRGCTPEEQTNFLQLAANLLERDNALLPHI